MVELETKRKKILKIWQDKILESYPVTPAVEITGYIGGCTSKIFDKVIEVYKGGDYEGIEVAADDLMRFLAVDGKLTPGESIAYLFYLKKLIDNEFPETSKKEWQKISDIVDKIGYIAFNKYMEAREDVFKLRLFEKNRDLEIAGKIVEYSTKFLQKQNQNLKKTD